MNDLEQQIRQSLDAQAELAPELNLTSVLPAATIRGRSSWRFGRLAPVLTAAALGLSALGITVAVERDPDSSKPAPDAVVTEPLDPGMQEISYHGAQIQVPLRFKLFNGACGTSTQDVVVTFPGSVGCALPGYGGPPPDYSKGTEVEMAPVTQASDTNQGMLQALATHDVTVAGEPARQGTGKVAIGYDNRSVTVLVIPSVEVVISVRSNHLELAKQLLSTVRLNAIDRNRCLAHLDSWHPVAHSNTHGDPHAQLVPGAPELGSICSYYDDWLVHSIQIPNAQLASTLGVLGGLQAGMTRYVFGQSAAAGCEAAKRDGVLMNFRYSDDSEQTVWIHTTGCIGMSANNGSLRTQISAELMQLIQNDGVDQRLISHGGSFLRPMTDAEISQFADQQP